MIGVTRIGSGMISGGGLLKRECGLVIRWQEIGGGGVPDKWLNRHLDYSVTRKVLNEKAISSFISSYLGVRTPYAMRNPTLLSCR